MVLLDERLGHLGASHGLLASTEMNQADRLIEECFDGSLIVALLRTKLLVRLIAGEHSWSPPRAGRAQRHQAPWLANDQQGAGRSQPIFSAGRHASA